METLASYRAKVASLALSLIEGNTFAYAIYRLATLPSPGGLDPGPWEGTAGELPDTLRRICTDARFAASDLPDDVRAVGRQVREIAPCTKPESTSGPAKAAPATSSASPRSKTRRSAHCSLMSHMGHSTVPPSAQVGSLMGHVGHHPGPFLTRLSPPRRAP